MTMCIISLPQVLAPNTWTETLNLLGGLIRTEAPGHFSRDNAPFQSLLKGHRNGMQSQTSEAPPVAEFVQLALEGRIHALDYVDLFVLAMAIDEGWQAPGVETQIIGISEVYPEGLDEEELSPLARLAIRLQGPLWSLFTGPWDAELFDLPQVLSKGAIQTWTLEVGDIVTLRITTRSAWQKILTKNQQRLGLGEADRITLKPGLNFRKKQLQRMRLRGENPASLLTRSRHEADIKRKERPLKYYLHDIHYHGTVMSYVRRNLYDIFLHISEGLQACPLLNDFPQLQGIVKKNIADFAAIRFIQDNRVYEFVIRDLSDLCRVIAHYALSDLYRTVADCHETARDQKADDMAEKIAALFEFLYHHVTSKLPNDPRRQGLVEELLLLNTYWPSWDNIKPLVAEKGFTGLLVEDKILQAYRTRFPTAQPSVS